MIPCCTSFAALVLFAKGNYQPAAAMIHSLLAVGPGWDWATLSSMYPNVSVYTAQLRKLESFVREHPKDGAARFLLAYQYLSCGNVDAAEKPVGTGRASSCRTTVSPPTC